ncbi:MAG: sigma-54 dependent transcriptional regulator [Planctomycetota bacterium]
MNQSGDEKQATPTKGGRRPVILVVDDELFMRTLMRRGLEKAGYKVEDMETGEAALAFLEKRWPDLILLDVMLPELSGVEILRRVHQMRDDLPVIVVSGVDEVSTAVECLRLGAVDFVQKPFEEERLLVTIRNTLERTGLQRDVIRLKDELCGKELQRRIIGASPKLRQVLGLIEKVRDSNITVLIEGESGVGKELVARTLHETSGRSAGPFVSVNCGAIPESLLESELFGHEKGAFTGATSSRPGRFEQSNGGTLFLDEIGEMTMPTQVRLLRALQERVVQRVGGTADIPIDLRVVCATNKDLALEIKEDRFRKDLYFRIAAFPIYVPPLRERREDIANLAAHFFDRIRTRDQRDLTGIDPKALQALEEYPWPGNVRELENVIERAVLIQGGPVIQLESLPAYVSEESLSPVETDGTFSDRKIERQSDEILSFEEEEKNILIRALKITGGNIQEASERLRIGRATLYRKIQKYGIHPG